MQVANDLFVGFLKLLIQPISKMYNLEVRGGDVFDSEVGGVIAYKHQSYLDILWVMHLSPKPNNFPAHKGLFWGPIGVLLRLGGAFPITRPKDKGYRNQLGANIEALRMYFKDHVKEGGLFAYSPEGTRLGGEMGKVHTGFIRTALEEELPVYLMGINYDRVKWPWMPGTNTVISFERFNPSYDVGDKTFRDELAQDVGTGLGRLSGLEDRIDSAT